MASWKNAAATTVDRDRRCGAMRDRSCRSRRRGGRPNGRGGRRGSGGPMPDACRRSARTSGRRRGRCPTCRCHAELAARRSRPVCRSWAARVPGSARDDPDRRGALVAPGPKWCHLVSDVSLDELHAFADANGIPRAGSRATTTTSPRSSAAELIDGRRDRGREPGAAAATEGSRPPAHAERAPPPAPARRHTEQVARAADRPADDEPLEQLDARHLRRGRRAPTSARRRHRRLPRPGRTRGDDRAPPTPGANSSAPGERTRRR